MIITPLSDFVLAEKQERDHKWWGWRSTSMLSFDCAKCVVPQRSQEAYKLKGTGGKRWIQ